MVILVDVLVEGIKYTVPFIADGEIELTGQTYKGEQVKCATSDVLKEGTKVSVRQIRVVLAE